jgi:hypothetical protein
MKHLNFLRTLALIGAVIVMAYIVSCNSEEKKEKDDAMSENKMMSKEDMIKRGDYIVTTGACHDCHSPKNLGPHGEPFLDSSRLMSGHPADGPMPALDANAGKPGGWIYLSPDITSFVGPWGISYAANLTPDTATGIGNWTEEQFINTLRNGKHLGNGRDILPPMPWPFVARMTDDDLKSVFAFLKSLKAISNRVPAPVTPPELAGMIKK